MRKLCTFALPCAAAILLSVRLLPVRLLLPLEAAAGMVGLVVWALRRGSGGLRWRLICFGLCFGFLWTGAFAARTEVRAARLSGRTEHLTLEVADWPRRTRYGVSADVRVISGPGKGLGAVLYAEEDLGGLHPGDLVSGRMRLKLAHTIRGEETDYFYSKGRFLSLNPAEEPEIRPADRTPVHLWPALWARRIREQTAAAVPGEAAPLVTALVTGDRSGLSPSDSAALQRSGLAHAVAVSGLHVSFVAGFAIRLLGRNRRRTAVCTMVLMALFAGVAGFTPSVLRAAILQSLLMIAPLVGRENDAPTSLSAALMVLLLWNPYAGAGLSLPLSFAAVAGIYCCSERLFRLWTGGLSPEPALWKRLCRMAAAALSTTLGAMVFTVPITALELGSVSLIAPLSNLLVLWAVALSFSGGLIAALLGFVHAGAAALVGKLTALPAGYVLAAARKLGGVPAASVPMENVYFRAWLILAYVMLLLGILSKWRMILPVCLCLCSLCACLFLTEAEYRGCGLTSVVLDVGEGRSTAFFSKGRSVLVDCGGSQRQNAGDLAADYLQSSGCARLDLLVLTDLRPNHADGVAELLERLPVTVLAMPETTPDCGLFQEITALAREKGTEVYLIREASAVQLGRAYLRLLPAPGRRGEGDVLSVLCSRDEFDVLLPGEMGAAAEGQLAACGGLPEVEVLVTDGRSGMSQTFTDAVQPRYAVLSTGSDRYGRTDAGMLEWLVQSGAGLYRTDWMGNITFRVN